MTPDTFDSLFWSYTAIWVLVVVYVATLGARVRRLESAASKDKKCCDVRE